MRRTALFLLAAAALASAAPSASAVDCGSGGVYVIEGVRIERQDLNCWQDYAESRVQIVLDKLPV